MKVVRESLNKNSSVSIKIKVQLDPKLQVYLYHEEKELCDCTLHMENCRLATQDLRGLVNRLSIKNN